MFKSGLDDVEEIKEGIRKYWRAGLKKKFTPEDIEFMKENLRKATEDTLNKFGAGLIKPTIEVTIDKDGKITITW